MSAAGGERGHKRLQHVVLKRYGPARARNRIESPGVPLIDFLQAYQWGLYPKNLLRDRLHPLRRIRALHLLDDLADADQELWLRGRRQHLKEI